MLSCEKLRALANQRRRFGYRRLHILLRRDGVMINRKKTEHLYKEEGLAVRRRRSRKRAFFTIAPAPVLALPNKRWSLVFFHAQMASGRRFRILNLVDDAIRECLAAVPDTRPRAMDRKRGRSPTLSDPSRQARFNKSAPFVAESSFILVS